MTLPLEWTDGSQSVRMLEEVCSPSRSVFIVELKPCCLYEWRKVFSGSEPRAREAFDLLVARCGRSPWAQLVS